MIGPIPYTITATAGEGGGAPIAFTLDQNYPNPFNPITVIRFTLPLESHVRLTVYNSLGEEAARPVDGVRTAGWQTVEFDASGLPSGFYTYLLTAGLGSLSRKMILMK